MSWEDAPQIESGLHQALKDFSWQRADEICTGLVDRIRTKAEPYPEASARRILFYLRRKRQYGSMTLLSEALLQSGLHTPQIRRQYAQALIDQGMLAAAEAMLNAIIQEPQGVKAEELEVRGLTGRIYKQLYINNNDSRSVRNRANLERSLNEYLYVYGVAPQENLWHGINVVALVARAQRDNLPLTGLPDSAAMARDIVAAIKDREDNAPQPLQYWDLATLMEAHIALGNDKEAADAAFRYVDSDGCDAFELSSTIRQLSEVWQLGDQNGIGNMVLPILRAAHMKTEGAAENRSPEAAREAACVVNESIAGLECIFGPDRMVTLVWYKKGLDQCNSVARVERRNGKGYGTGWLVKAEDFFPGLSGCLLLTNNHVVSASPNPFAIFPDECQINFQAMGEVLQIEDEVVWSSPYTDLDASFLRLRGEPKAPPITLHPRAMQMGEPAPRLYIIGHPHGRDLELSLQDNHMVGCNDRFLHYRTPTEPGSSGSVVYEPEDWQAVALHHKGSEKMKRIDGTDGIYEANEGISVLALQKATKGI